ncbi:MAG: gluconokinase [Rhodoferax sp.]|nr:gluconokinase [Rhodoferax sp.]
MGVSGCGKSSLAAALSQSMGGFLIEGDDFHSAGNKAKMHAGVALTDEDRAGWLAALGLQLGQRARGTVLSCSALKRAYRATLRAASPGLRFIFLYIDLEHALARVQARAGEHFFHPALVHSQFEALEAPTGEAGVLRLDATQPLSTLCEAARGWLAHQTTEPGHFKDETP